MSQIDLEDLLPGRRKARKPKKTAAEAKTANKNKQTVYRAGMRKAGFRQVNVWLPPSHAADFQLAAEKIRKDPDLALGPMRRVSTGKHNAPWTNRSAVMTSATAKKSARTAMN